MKSIQRSAGRYGRALLSMAALAMLAACGGGTEQIEPFAPTRIIALGDESSLITPEGKKYTINAVNATTGALECNSNPIWVQTLASSFSMVFPECNPDKVAAPQGLMRAQAGAKVAGVKSQIDTLLVAGIGPKDLISVLVGANDVLELYAKYPAQSKEALLAEARARGKALGGQVNRLANANGRIILSTLPDMGFSPLAVIDGKRDATLPKFMSDLTREFNLEMRVEIINDGRLIGLVLTDENTQVIAKYPSSFGISNFTDAACLATPAMPACTNATLTPEATKDNSWNSYLWASDRLYAPAGHVQVGRMAATRARNNPF
ncbi:SGNH/GDSL hydrolase family protein [Roseateles oligotrophus]|uniref:Esterase n=1 Tax=Roseateles oligotrophus TaxID=1769250 RepID=A0ABT2YHK3_9BURK|nr:esterase [Roseateles oligotrophus]MCV2369540.1 esterase [Roseateles oligotrophus]